MNNNTAQWKLVCLYPGKKGKNSGMSFTGSLPEILTIVEEKGLISPGRKSLPKQPQAGKRNT
jgi:hypothetical protein